MKKDLVCQGGIDHKIWGAIRSLAAFMAQSDNAVAAGFRIVVSFQPVSLNLTLPAQLLL
jgi:hypothetical protein